MNRTLYLGRKRVGIELRQFFRDRESAIFNFALPMILLVIFGSVFAEQRVGFGDVTFSQYFLAGMIASGVLYTSFQNLAIAIPMERDDGTLKRLQGLPMPKASYFLGKIGLVFVAYIAQVTVVAPPPAGARVNSAVWWASNGTVKSSLIFTFDGDVDSRVSMLPLPTFLGSPSQA